MRTANENEDSQYSDVEWCEGMLGEVLGIPDAFLCRRIPARRHPEATRPRLADLLWESRPLRLAWAAAVVLAVAVNLLLAGALPIGAVFVMLVAPPTWLSDAQLFWWVMAATLLFHTGMTVFGMPHDRLV